MVPSELKTKSSLDVFKVLQKQGKLSYTEMARKTALPITTVRHAYERLKKQSFFEVKATPVLDQFSQLSIAFISFSLIKDLTVLKSLEDMFIDKDEVRGFIVGQNQVLVVIMHKDEAQLNQLIHDMMKTADQVADLHILSPDVRKWDMTIPDHILDSVYSKM